MAQQLWSFIRNFSATKFYEAAQAGGLTGTAPFSFGAIFATENAPQNGQSIFGNRVIAPGSGFGLDIAAGAIRSQSGTALLDSVPQVAATGVPLPPGTGAGSTQDLANAFLSDAIAGETFGGEIGVRSPFSVELAFAVVTVAAGGNMSFYVNGHLINAIAVAGPSNNNAIRIGCDVAGATPSTVTWIAGCFYHTAVYTAANIAAMQAACAQAKDLVGPDILSQTTVPAPAYVWSVKRGNPDIRANWVSDGSAVTPITMVRNGTWSPASGVTSDNLAGEVPWMSL